MSRPLISRSPDLLRLREEGFNVRHIPGHIVVWDVPYLDQTGAVQRGMLISTATLQDDVAVAPDDHTVYFAGSMPYDQNGRPMMELLADNNHGVLPGGLTYQFRFSQKLASGQNYPNYYDKFRRYISFLVGPAQLKQEVSAATRQPVEAEPEESVFVLEDTWSPRARISALVDRFKPYKIGIVGVGGTGAHVLDLIAKTPVAQIHLFDGDMILQRNIWRLPGATSRETVRDAPNKAEHYAQLYSALRREVVPHAIFINESNVSELGALDFVFVCIDNGPSRRIIATWLSEHGVPFIDVGMGMSVIDDEKIKGMARITLIEPGTLPEGLLPYDEINPEDDIYDTNIQTVELNCLNAALAVIQWKKRCGFYADPKPQLQSLYTVAANRIVSRAGN